MAKTRTKENNVPAIIPADVKPPAVPEIEAAVLGAMLIEKNAVSKAMELLKPDSFYHLYYRYNLMVMIKNQTTFFLLINNFQMSDENPYDRK